MSGISARRPDHTAADRDDATSAAALDQHRPDAIPVEVRTLLSRRSPTVARVDMLLALRAAAPRACPMTEIAAAAQLPVGAVAQRCTNELIEAGLVTRLAGHPGYRYTPSLPELRASVDALALWYAKRRVVVIRALELIEAACATGEQALGLAVWTEDEAGPFQTIPVPGQQWRPAEQPARYPHEHIRDGTAKLLTLFHPRTGEVRVQGVPSCTNVVLHGWLECELEAVLATLPAPPARPPAENRACWARWQRGLAWRFTLRDDLPPLRMLLVLDNLTGHKTPAFVCWLMDHGVMPLYTPLGGSWLNMTESVQRILIRRGLAGTHPESVASIIDQLEATAAGWNAAPTPFEWGGRRAARRQRARERRHQLGGSGACTRRPVRRVRLTAVDERRRTNQVSHSQ